MDQIEEFSKQWRALHLYVKCMQGVVSVWRKFLLDTFQSEYFSKVHLQTFLDHIDVSVSVLRDRYAYDMSNVLHINAGASGFPFAYDMRISATQHRDLISGKEQPVDLRKLKKAYVDHLFAKQEINYFLLQRVAKAQAQNTLSIYAPLELFRISGIAEVEAFNGSDAYLCVWERFDYRNIPSLYAMIFEYHDVMDKKMLKDFALVLREETSYMPVLSRLGNRIDYAFAHMRPKWIGRIILGPVFISAVTQSEHLLQKVLDDAYDGEQYIAASRIISEHIMSSAETPMRALFDPQGNRHKVLQEWAVRTTDQECYDRGVSAVEKFLFAPHHIIQMLGEEYRKKIGHEIVGGE